MSKLRIGAVRCRALAVGGALVVLVAIAAPAAQANFKWSSGTPFSGEIELKPACRTATSITVDWGDGSATTAGALDFNSAVTGNHTFAATGTYAGTLTFGDGSCAGEVDPFKATIVAPPQFTQCPPVRLDSGCAVLIAVANGGAQVLRDPTQGPYEGDEDALIGVQNNSSGPISSIPVSIPTTGKDIDLFGFDQDGLCDPGAPPVPSGCVAVPGAPACGPEYGGCAFPRPAGEPAGWIEPGALTNSTQNGYEGPTDWYSNVSAGQSSGVVNFSPAIPPGGSTYFSLELAPTAAISAAAPPVDIDSSGSPTVKGDGARFSGIVKPNGLSTNAYFQYGLDSRYSTPGTSGPVYDHRTPSQPIGGDFSPHLVTASVSNLVPNALYHARLVATNRKGTTYGPDVEFRSKALAKPGAPALGKTVNIAPVDGLVLFVLDGQVVPLTQARQVPANTQIDALQGGVKVFAAKAPVRGHGAGRVHAAKRHRHSIQSGTFAGAIFRLNQTTTGPTAGLVGLTLVEGIFKGAPTLSTCTAATATRTLQTLRVSARGLFATRGRYGSATGKRSRWTIADRCDGTRVHDVAGSVVVKDAIRHGLFVLSPGRTYMAKPRG
ncbi:MAG TPA: hypothetical protein VGF93_16260 [Solirubrobacteraceae bacterium]